MANGWDVTAPMVAKTVALVQTVKGDFALWIDGQETGMTVPHLDRIRYRDYGELDTLTLVIEAGRLELRA